MESAAGADHQRGRWLYAYLGLLVVGVLLQLWFWTRAVWIYRDQVELYLLGWTLARDGTLQSFGKLATGDYPIPGVLLQLLVGLPLRAWLDFRAPTVVLLIFHGLAAWLLGHTLARDLGWRFATVFLAVFWISPWRLYHSGFLWETNYLFLPAALHLWACSALRHERRIWPSAALAATLVLTAQLHGSFMIPLVATALLAWRGRIRLHFGGALTGALAGAITLLPTLLALVRGAPLPAETAGLPSLLTRLNSVEKGLLYWFRLSSLDLGRRFRQSLYCLEPGSEATPHPWLCRLVELTQVLAVASIAVSFVAAWWFFRRRRERDAADTPSSFGWYRGYSFAHFAGVLVAAVLSPVLLQSWHVLIAVPAACLPVAFWIFDRWPKADLLLRAVILIFVLWRLPASLLLLGHPMYVTPPNPDFPRHIVPVELHELIRGLDRQFPPAEEGEAVGSS